MKNPGPLLEALIDRLIAIPEEFPGGRAKSADSGEKTNLPALINDLLIDNGGTPLSDDEISLYFTDKKKSENNLHHDLVSILCYIFEDEFFTEKQSEAELIKSFLLSPGLIELSKTVKSADEFINDPERREEICRMALNALNYFPLGETEKNAEDRLLTLDSVERKKILAKTSEARERAKQLREAMMRKEAEEAASKMSRE
jgi:hypothetical protein